MPALGSKITLSTPSHNSTQSTKELELFDVLNGLKWFEIHNQFGKTIIESEIFDFKFMDTVNAEPVVSGKFEEL